MSSPQGTPPRLKTALLSRHWKLAVLAAAGFATVIGTTTTTAGASGIEHRKSEGAPGTPAASAKGYAGKGDEASHGKADHGDKSGKSGKDDGNKGDKSRHDKYGDGHGEYSDDAIHVECDPAALLAAVVSLNSDRGGELVLAKDCTYTLTANEDDNGLPTITQPITIYGNGATIQRAANGDNFRIFEVGVGGDLKLSHLTITRGKIGVEGEGAGIRVSAAGRLGLDHVTLTRNSSDLETSDGGAIYNDGITTIRNSTLSKNTSEDGAAVYNGAGKLDIADSKITGNVNDEDDGWAAIYNGGGSVKIKKSVLSYNRGNSAGALYNSTGVSEVEKSAFVYNFGDSYGAIHTDDSLYVRDSTIAYNTATDEGPGLHAGSLFERTKIYGNIVTDGDGGGANVSTSDDNPVVFRSSKIYNNQAPGNGHSGGGLYISNGTVNLTDTKITGNVSDAEAGGVHNLGTVTTNGKVKIIDNVPTNCEAPGTNPVPNCFG
ncbi:right-handed parallel beta-helix repeat-containing protein [Streptomyces sp. NPDC127084]|uniref:right-handed parallel beta-helix repeat-containing protein n=1 Tax=Streptomyces sp. NPDC127084 TaxID=3347133 RepID=UPI003646778A